MRHLSILAVVLIASLGGLAYRTVAQTPTQTPPSQPPAPVSATPPATTAPKSMKLPTPDTKWGPAGGLPTQTQRTFLITNQTQSHVNTPTQLPVSDVPPATKPNMPPPMPVVTPEESKSGPALGGPVLGNGGTEMPSGPTFSPPPALDSQQPLPAPVVAPQEKPSAPAAPASRTASPIMLTGAQTPSVYLEKIGPATISVGKPLVYEIVARNSGSTTVSNVRVEDQLPTGARFLSAEPKPELHSEHMVWNIGNLEAGAERRIRVEIQPTGEGELTAAATVTFSASSGLKTQITRPKIALTQSAPETVQVGDTTTFQIHIANVGTGPATNLVLHSNLPAGLSHEKGSKIDADLGVLAPGESRIVPLATTAVRSGRQQHEVSITGDDGIQTVAHTVVMVTEPVLTLRATGPKRRYLNREAQFNLEVVNSGTGRAANVYVCNVLPEGMDFISASEGGTYDPASRAVAWQISVLTPGQRQAMVVKACTKSLGTLVNRAIARDERGLETKVETCVNVEGLTGLFLEVVDLDDAMTVGGDVGYEIRVVNQGTAPSTGVQLVANVPVGMTVKGVTGPSAHRVQGQQVIFEALPSLAPRADAVYRLAVSAQQAGDMRMKVQLTSEQVKTPIIKEESTHVYSDPDELVTSTSTGSWKQETVRPDGSVSP